MLDSCLFALTLPEWYVFNEWYARDISKKRRISNKIRGTSGEPMSQPPYGYVKNPENPKRWIVDEEAARIVRRVFSLTMDGYGTEQIAALLDGEKVITPLAYWRGKGINRAGVAKDLDMTRWGNSTIIKMLSLQEYCGDLINFKTYSKSYKNKKRIANDHESMAIFRDVHEPIIDRATWEKVQEKRGKVRKPSVRMVSKTYFRAFLYARTAVPIYTFTSTRKTTRFDISTAPITTAVVAHALQHTTSV